jgi:CRP-like cAMP-binding protein
VPTLAETAEFLKSVRLFREIAEADRMALAQRLREQTLKKGQALFREGDAGEEMFLVRSGAIIVSKAVTGRVEQVLARMGPGDFFGEMSLLDHAPRSATIQADSDTMLLVLDSANLIHLVEVNPRAAVAFFHALVQVFVQRLRDTGDLVAEVTRWGLEATGLDVDSR